MAERLPAWTADWWRPIETAPKDGTQILICRKDDDIGADEIEITEWCEHYPMFNYEQAEGTDLYRKIEVNPGRPGFWNGNGHRATHWMPLPPQPR